MPVRPQLPLNALRAFEAAARHLNFSRAADELSVTPGAVSQQIQNLEDYVGADGSVEDYRILSDGDDSEELLPQVKNMLIFTTFRPATSMGRPMPGRAVLSFSKISVKG